MTIAATLTARRQPPLADTDEETGHRWYIHPKTSERFISVSTVTGTAEKYGLGAWYGRLAAEEAFSLLSGLVRASRRKPCGATKTPLACRECVDCLTVWLSRAGDRARDAAAALGVKVHDAEEQRTIHGTTGDVDEDAAPYVAQLQRWRDIYRPDPYGAEMTVINRKYGYAGTLDTILRFPRRRCPLPAQLADLRSRWLVADWKTGKHIGIPEGWQTCAYAHAEAILLPDGTELPMPPITAGLIVHVRPEGVAMRRVAITDEVMAAFLAMLTAATALHAGLNTVVSRPIHLPRQPRSPRES